MMQIDKEGCPVLIMLNITAYHCPTTISEAVTLLAEEGRTVIAGGTDLLVNPRYMVGVREVVDIRKLGLDYIRQEYDCLCIGAGVTMRVAAQHPQIQQLADGILARSAAVCGSPNIRNTATLVGNITSALPSADTPPSLLALDTQVVLAGIQRERVVPLVNFFVGPAKSVRERELLREVRIPLHDISNKHGGFFKLGRTAEDISVVNAAAALVINDGIITTARLVMGAVAPVPLRALQAEEALLGQPAREETFQKAAVIAREEVRPISDQRASSDYRRRMSEVAALRALRQAAGLSPRGEEWRHA
ncbi:MAG TPA: FAD binding domain-containing protein [Ktedonobacteraceae bacterium]|nr:FAD binding domain-containing protein [Ktedonobacteraceae bacterium]